MKFILKGKEPEAWKTYRNTEGVIFSAITELKIALLEQQGYICCYCMSRINFESMKVEHWKPRKYKALIFHFDNLLAACKGDFCTEKHCDTRKDDIEILINPSDKANNIESLISYKWSDGSLKYSPHYKKDIEDVLNLNNPILKNNRKKVMEAVSQVLMLKKYSESEHQKQLKKFKEVDKHGKFQPYCMVAVRFLEKKIRKFK